MQALVPEAENLFDEEEQLVLELSGHVVINGFSNTLLQEVEVTLQTLAKDLVEAWDNRQSMTVLQQNMVEAF